MKMEKEIKKILKNKYRRLHIFVDFKNFREYTIEIGIEYKEILYESLIEYKYDAYLSLEENCDRIEEIIDNKIILNFYKKGDNI